MQNQAIHCDILLSDVRYLAPDMTIVSGKSIAVSGGHILDIVDAGDQTYQAGTVLPGKHLLWMPGLVDGHTHTSQQLLRGRLLDEKPVIWKRVNVPFESRLDPEMSRLSAELAAMEMISCGTTGFVDAGGKYPEVFAEVYQRSGLRGRLSVMTNDSPHAPESLRALSVPEAVARLRAMKGALSGGRLKPIYSVTTPTAVSEELLRTVFEAAAEDGVPVETHMNEYASEVTEFIERYGLRPFAWLEREGLLSASMTAPHCIFLDQEEIEILARRRVRVAHCPFSNCGKGVPPTPQLLRAGVSVGFGTDGTAHGGVDLFREMRLFRGVMNVTRGIAEANSSVMPAETLLRMATQGGAAALFEPGLGAVTPGAPADLIAVDTDAPHLWPTQNLVHTLVESAGGADVRHSIVDGTLVMKDRELLTLDRERIRREAELLFEKNPWLCRW
ncbi:MAG: amidohydrolase family protein [Oscillospiraceae bacterium]|nr:amidohydrolase family protein [Oscillospiraceae bacterium]